MALRPGGWWRLVLPSDAELPDPQPCFRVKNLNGHEWMELSAAIAEIRDRTQGPEAFAAMLNLAWPHLAGWEDMIDPGDGREIAFSRENLPRLIGSVSEAFDLLYGILGGARLSELNRKNSVPPSSGRSGTSAPGAPTPPAAAEASDAPGPRA